MRAQGGWKKREVGVPPKILGFGGFRVLELGVYDFRGLGFWRFWVLGFWDFGVPKRLRVWGLNSMKVDFSGDYYRFYQGFGVWGLGFGGPGFWGLGFTVWSLGFGF